MRLCSWPGCERPHDGHGLCGSHLKQLRRGTLGLPDGRLRGQAGVPEGMRRCTRCGQTKALEEFPKKSPTSRDYRCARCKAADHASYQLRRRRRARQERESCTDTEFRRMVDAAMERLGVPPLDRWGGPLLPPRGYWDEQHAEARDWAREAGVRVDGDGD